MHIGQMKTIALGAAALASLAASASAASAGKGTALTPAQIIQRSEQAYNSLKSYQGTVTTDSVYTPAQGSATPQQASAKISFSRPGNIRVDGKAMGGMSYAFVSNGAETCSQIGGNWKRAESAEMAVAGATGISLGAAATVPALLLHLNWGYPFIPSAKMSDQAFGPVTKERVGGTLCYRFTDTRGGRMPSTETFWFDSKTFLLTRMIEDTKLTTARMRSDQHITTTQINTPIPASTFALPDVSGG